MVKALVEKVDYLEKQLDMNHDDAVKHVESIITEEGFSVMLVKDIDKIFKKKLGVEEYPRYTIICACGPKFAKAALDASWQAGFLFPCSFVVHEKNGKTWVSHISIMKIAPAIGLADPEAMEPVIKMTGDAVHAAWDRF
ncbi:DUF302 domain-containing protein [Candidatus Bathyarchaeota archaeon]|nr:DUF302 domain-containing protein [Candidatus Bathyarchaeota archaeon]